jgi:hypothetical protein
VSRSLQSLAAFLASCITACAVVHVPEPTLEMAGGSSATLTELQSGYQTYRGKCSGCHALFPVEEYDSEEWESGVAKMIRLKKVKLQPEEREQLLKYLSASSAPAAAGVPGR